MPTLVFKLIMKLSYNLIHFCVIFPKLGKYPRLSFLKIFKASKKPSLNILHSLYLSNLLPLLGSI